MSRLRLLVWVSVAAALLNVPTAFAAAPYPTVTVQLGALNSSGQTGTAVLSDNGNDTTHVVVTITGEPAGASEPMHIHTGQCGPTLGNVAFPLTNVVDGKSTTDVNKGLDDLEAGGFAINGHKSAAEIGTYVFCGNIPVVPQTAPTTGGTLNGQDSVYLALLLMGSVLSFAGAWLWERTAKKV